MPHFNAACRYLFLFCLARLWVSSSWTLLTRAMARCFPRYPFLTISPSRIIMYVLYP